MLRRRNNTTIVLASFFTLLAGSAAAQNTTSGDVTIVSKTTAPKGVPVTGTITDAVSNKGIAGVRVKVEGFSAAITDASGTFTLNVPSYTSMVSVESEGYDARNIPLKGRRSIQVALLDDAHESVGEMVTLPFGRKNKTEVTAAVSQYNLVNAAWTQPNEMPDATLQGRIPGLNVIRRSGTPGAGANLFLRGYNSLYATNKPLIIVDNMLYDANQYGASIIANNYTNPLALIDIKDIDNITVLKDASSIYGTRGANGAIIITTAKAQSQATKIDFAAYTGFNLAPKTLPVMEAGDYRTYLSEILQSKGMSSAQIQAQPFMTDDPNNAEYARYHYNTNWQKRVLANSVNQNYFLKVTGGDNIATYGLSVGFTNNSGIIKETNLTRYNTRFNADFNFTKRFTGATNLSFSYNEQNLKDQGISDKTAPLFLSLIKAPFLHDREVDARGVESPNLSDRDTLGITNPSSIIDEMIAENKYYRFFGSFAFNYDISKSFKASSTVGIVIDKVRESFFVPRKGVADDTLTNAIASSRLGSQVKRLFTIYNDTRLEFNKVYNSINSVAARVGIRYQKNKSEQDFSLGYNSATDDLVSVQNGVAALRQVGGGVGDWNWMNLYLGADYGYRSKLFLNVSAAMDGSSRFGKQAPNGVTFMGNRFAVMPSVGLAWLVSSENFMANSALDLLKIRGTYSITGNDDIGNYSTRQTYTSQSFLGAQGLVRTGIVNPALQWETVNKLNGGVDLAFWNERVSLSLDAYQNRTENMLVYDQLATISGFDNILTNSGRMQNTGLEASLNVRVINSANVKWDLGVNAATYKNKILAVPNGRIETKYAGATILTEVGKSANLFYGYTTSGVFATDADAAGFSQKSADGSFVTFKGGDVKFNDLNNDKIIDQNDKSVIGDPSPDFTGGFNNRIMFRRFEINALFTFSQGNDIYNYLRYRLESASGVENQLMSVNNRWRGQGHITNVPKATWGDPVGNSRFSDRWIEDGSYFRLRSLSLQYSWPMKTGSFLKSVSLYGTANNVFTLTKYKGYDPEFSVTQSVFTQGTDTGLDPQFRNVTLGVRIGL